MLFNQHGKVSKKPQKNNPNLYQIMKESPQKNKDLWAKDA